MAVAILAVCLGLAGWDLFPEGRPDEDLAGIQEQVEYLLSHPLDVNAATGEELATIPWLNPVLAGRIVTYRDSVGRLRDAAQLLEVPGMTPPLYRLLARVVTTDEYRPQGWAGGLVLRAGSDTLAAGSDGANWFGRLRVERGRWLGVALLEKDRGENRPADWTGLGLQYWDGQLGAVAGDFTPGSGLGLVLGGPHRSSVEYVGSRAVGPVGLRSVNTAAETRALRGVGVEYLHGGWHGMLFGSRRRLDARLNDDGTVARLRLDGVHDDSAARAEQNLVTEAGGGVLLGRHAGPLFLTCQAGAASFDRDFAPADSTNSLVGRQVAFGSFAANLLAGPYRLGFETGVSSAGGLAGAAEIDGSWSHLDVGLAMTSYSGRFLAPYGRWRSLTGRSDRLHARFSLDYAIAGFDVAVRGRTYRDFDEDSLPAGVELDLAQQVGRLNVGLELGWQFRLASQRQRNAALELEYRPRPGRGLTLRLEDRYPESGSGRGVLAGASARLDPGRFRIAGSIAGAFVSGTGVRLYWSEPGVMRIGQSFSAGRSSWRFCCAAGSDLTGWAELTLKLGATLQDTVALDITGQVQFSIN